MSTGKERVQTRWLISTILRHLGKTEAVKGESSTAVVASVVSVLLVIIVGAVAGVIFWRR